jgi:uncharacterized protein YlbG (UPF0298 family)
MCGLSSRHGGVGARGQSTVRNFKYSHKHNIILQILILLDEDCCRLVVHVLIHVSLSDKEIHVILPIGTAHFSRFIGMQKYSHCGYHFLRAKYMCVYLKKKTGNQGFEKLEGTCFASKISFSGVIQCVSFISRAEHKQHRPDCPFLKIKDPYNIAVGDILDLEKTATENFIVRNCSII